MPASQPACVDRFFSVTAGCDMVGRTWIFKLQKGAPLPSILFTDLHARKIQPLVPHHIRPNLAKYNQREPSPITTAVTH
jgi:hypothetical protein